MGRLTGKVAIVTGASKGIGDGIAKALAAEGAAVAVNYASSREGADRVVAEITKAGGKAIAVQGDVSKAADVKRLVAETVKAFGGLDVLVNNAGIAGPTGGIQDIDPAEWRRTIDVNLSGQFYCARLAVPMLLQAGDGVIINMASVAGRLGYAFRTPYASSKWAIRGLTESLARELGPNGIRVNAILPGIVEGPRMTRVIDTRAKAMGVDYASMEKSYLDKISLRRMTDMSDVAEMVLFLCSSGGRNISGQSLSICGNVETL